jgi:hypothetical protein
MLGPFAKVRATRSQDSLGPGYDRLQLHVAIEQGGVQERMNGVFFGRIVNLRKSRLSRFCSKGGFGKPGIRIHGAVDENSRG